MGEPTALRIETVAVTSGRPAGPGAPVTPPVAFNATYRSGGAGYSYGRNGNPTWSAFEEALGALEGGQALAFSSGLAAASAVIETLPVGAVVVAPRSAYHGFRILLADLEKLGRLQVRAVDVTDAAATIAALDGAGLLWLETPTNPLLEIADLRALLPAARERNIVSVVDNTFATPILQRPLELGADVVVHSATKYLGGHSDLVLGAVVTRDDALIAQLHRRRTLHGAIPGVMESWLALRGMRTLPLRVECAQYNAGLLATRLREESAVGVVRYPGLGDHPGHAIAATQMSGFGAMLSFELADSAAAQLFTGRLRLVVDATSLGGVETTIDRRNQWPGEEGTAPGLLRLSVGVEHVEDIWSDLSAAFGTS